MTSATRHMNKNSDDWLQTAARIGHLAKGIVYALIGVLAIREAIGQGGQVAGGQEAVQYLGSQPFGQVMLVLIGAGLGGYAIWRFLMAAQDTEGDGDDAMGVVKRLGYAVSGVVNGALAYTALEMAFGTSGGGGSAQGWTAQLMSLTFGRVLVFVVGVSIVGVGFHQLYVAYEKRFMERLNTSAMSAKVRQVTTRLGQIGCAARGVVFPIIGVALVTAAVRHDPSQAKGLGAALRSVATSGFGQVMLILVAAGFIAYGIYMVAAAKYRRVNIQSPV